MIFEKLFLMMQELPLTEKITTELMVEICT